jgi:anti-sigma factor RsiW
MNEKHVLDTLSAYIDGEAAHPDRIARHLQHCESCARRHMQLLKLGSNLCALPGPEIPADFAARVLERIEKESPETGARRGRRWFQFALWQPVLLAAMALVTVGLAFTQFHAPAPAHKPPIAKLPMAATQSQAPLLSDEDADVTAMPMDEMLNLLAVEVQEDGGEQEAAGDETGDLYGAIDEIIAQEDADLRAVLTDYLHEISQNTKNKG